MTTIVVTHDRVYADTKMTILDPETDIEITNYNGLKIFKNYYCVMGGSGHNFVVTRYIKPINNILLSIIGVTVASISPSYGSSTGLTLFLKAFGNKTIVRAVKFQKITNKLVLLRVIQSEFIEHTKDTDVVIIGSGQDPAFQHYLESHDPVEAIKHASTIDPYTNDNVIYLDKPNERWDSRLSFHISVIFKKIMKRRNGVGME